MPWSQTYGPLGSVGVSALLAALPVVTLLGLLAFWHVRAQFAALAGLVVALLVAILVYHMPAHLAVAASLLGGAYGLFPIGWIILNAIFIYDLSVHTGQFAILQEQLSRVSGDRRIQALLIAFSFGAFIEGAAGFGTPVAISGALLIGLGFKPLEAAKLALIGNTAPVAFGALGIPLITLAKVTNLDLGLLSSMVGRQLGMVSIIIPFWLAVAQAGWRGMWEVWPACLVTGVSFGLTQFWVSNSVGPSLVGVSSAFVSMTVLVLLMQFWQPKGMQTLEKPKEVKRHAPAWRAWLPWIFLSVFVFVWGLAKVKLALDLVFSNDFTIAALNDMVQRVPPVVDSPTPEHASFAFHLLSATGTALLLAGFFAGLCLKLSPKQLCLIYARTVGRVRISLLTIALMLAIGYTTRYSGTDATLGLALASTGFLFPFFSPLIGWLGVALTGSDTSSNTLFGNLQQVTARQLHLSPILMAGSNSSGGVMGKMIDAQSIVVAGVATGGSAESPDPGTILRAVFWHSLALAVLMGLLVMLQAHILQWMIPVK